VRMPTTGQPTSRISCSASGPWSLPLASPGRESGDTPTPRPPGHLEQLLPLVLAAVQHDLLGKDLAQVFRAGSARNRTGAGYLGRS
jgi:hypothetical protein